MTEPLSPTAINAFFADHFPQIAPGRDFIVEKTGGRFAQMRLRYSERRLRPGGTISGPSMFELADLALYAAILAELGVGDDPATANTSRGALAVTTNLNINFLRKPEPGDLIADARLMKLGQRLIVGEAWLHAQGGGDPVAHATGTYSVPPPKG
ncbi:MAG: PaaI family thioesterase [Beijerinckiaceae bacterium]|nr:PaaI family thioesterase [Beijerinckiaceae bacterium]